MTRVTNPDAGVPAATVASAKQTVRQDPRDPAFYRDPARHYRDWHCHGGPLWWEEYGLWCLKDYSAVDSALRDRRLKRLPPAGDGTNDDGACSSPQWPAHLQAFARTERYSLLALEGHAHARLRRRAAVAFGSGRIAQLENDIRRVSREAAEAVAAAAPQADLLTLWARRIPVTVIARLLGVPEEEGEQLVTWSNAMVRVYTMTQTRAEEDAAESAAVAFEARLHALVRERRTTPQDDLVSGFCRLRGEEEMLDEEIVSLSILLLNAGHEATVHQLGNAVATLLQPGAPAFRHLFDSATTRDRLVTELGRYCTPLHLFVRHAQQDMSIAPGITVGRGERVGLLLGAANHDPARFDAPWRFDPQRRHAATLGFGAGVHYCLGVHLARLEIGIALEVLFQRLPHMSLAASPVVSDSWHFHGLDRLLVHPHGG